MVGGNRDTGDGEALFFAEGACEGGMCGVLEGERREMGDLEGRGCGDVEGRMLSSVTDVVTGVPLLLLLSSDSLPVSPTSPSSWGWGLGDLELFFALVGDGEVGISSLLLSSPAEEKDAPELPPSSSSDT